MGVVPLVISTGAGSEMRHAMGVAVFSGMIGVTAFGIFFTPMFYVLLRALAGNRPLTQHGQASVENIVVAGSIEIVPQDRSGLQGVVIVRREPGWRMRIALHVFQAAAPVRKSRCHAQRWKNIPMDRIGAADDAL